jgi:hypothetical protein
MSEQGPDYYPESTPTWRVTYANGTSIDVCTDSEEAARTHAANSEVDLTEGFRRKLATTKEAERAALKPERNGAIVKVERLRKHDVMKEREAALARLRPKR